MSITGRVLSGDHTFAVAKVPVGNSLKIFEAMFSLMNEYGEIIGYWMVPNTSLHEVKSDLEAVQRRYSRTSEPLEQYYTDSCCKERFFLSNTFPSLSNVIPGGYQRVSLDSFHFMRRYPVAKCDKFYSAFVHFLKLALFVESAEDLEQLRKIMDIRGEEKAHLTRSSMSYLPSNGRIRRKIPKVCLLIVGLI